MAKTYVHRLEAWRHHKTGERAVLTNTGKEVIIDYFLKGARISHDIGTAASLKLARERLMAFGFVHPVLHPQHFAA